MDTEKLKFEEVGEGIYRAAIEIDGHPCVVVRFPKSCEKTIGVRNMKSLHGYGVEVEATPKF